MRFVAPGRDSFGVSSGSRSLLDKMAYIAGQRQNLPNMKYLLIFSQNGQETPLVLFDNMEAARAFVRQIPGYRMTEEEGEDYSFTYETFSPDALPDHIEIEQNGNRVPVSRFMFRDKEDVEILWRELPDMSEPDQGLVDGQTLVDAYVIPNEEVERYISRREEVFLRVSAFLKGRGYDVDRSFRGSEDGEAVIYRRSGEEDWHFLTHMDPCFVDEAPEDEHEFEAWVDDLF